MKQPLLSMPLLYRALHQGVQRSYRQFDIMRRIEKHAKIWSIQGSCYQTIVVIKNQNEQELLEEPCTTMENPNHDGNQMEMIPSLLQHIWPEGNALPFFRWPDDHLLVCNILDHFHAFVETIE
jgi:hypothetical protein